MTVIERVANEPTDLGASEVSDNPVRGRANAWFFVLMDRYINWIARDAKHQAFTGITGQTICELGPGVGANFDYYPEGSRVVAIEPNLRMEPHLRRRARERGLDLDVHTTGAETIPLADDSVDEVLCSLVLCTAGDPLKVVDEVRRVLRPGGRFRFVEHIVAEPKSVRRGVQRVLHRPWAWGFEGCRLDRDTPALLEAAGFADVDLEVGRLRGSVFYPVNRVTWGVAAR